jgi:hypothetical protein
MKLSILLAMAIAAPSVLAAPVDSHAGLAHGENAEKRGLLRSGLVYAEEGGEVEKRGLLPDALFDIEDEGEVEKRGLLRSGLVYAEDDGKVEK